MITLAINEANERGKAFESFMAILLSKMGYQIVNTNVRRAGRELDIFAKSKVTTEPLLMECKALSKKCTGPDLSKFYGKYDHEFRKQSNLKGTMVSLSGYNSESKDYYDEKDNEVKQRFRILGPKEILELSVDADLIAADRTVQYQARKSWPFDLDQTLFVIASTGYYRIQLLKKDGKRTHFLVYRANCGNPTQNEIDLLHQSVGILKSLESFNLDVRREILLSLAQSKNPISNKELRETVNQSDITVETELAYLNEQRLVEKTSRGECSLVEDISAFCEVSKELLSTPHKYDFLSTHYFQKMNGPPLVNYCLNRRHLTLDESKKSVLNEIFDFCPTALDFALFGDIKPYQTSFEHAQEIDFEDKKLPKIMESRFFTNMFPYIIKDLHDTSNTALSELSPWVSMKEEYNIALSNTLGKIFELSTGTTITFGRISNSVKAGQLMFTDLMNKMSLYMSSFHLEQDRRMIEEMAQIFEKLEKTTGNKDDLARFANNIGFCYISLQDWPEARKWLEKGMELNDNIPELHANLHKVLCELGKPEDAAKHLKKANELNFETKDEYGGLKEGLAD